MQIQLTSVIIGIGTTLALIILISAFDVCVMNRSILTNKKSPLLTYFLATAWEFSFAFGGFLIGIVYSL